MASLTSPDESPYWWGWHQQTAGIAAWHQGRLAEARALLEGAIARAVELEEPKLELYSAVWLANVQLAQGDFEGARSIVHIFGERQKRSLDCAEQWIGGRLATAALAHGDAAEARQQFPQYSAQYLAYQIPFLTAEHAVIRAGIALVEGDLEPPTPPPTKRCAVELSNPWALVESHTLDGRIFVGGKCAPGRAEDLASPCPGFVPGA